MKPYGRSHKISTGKLHSADNCSICAERKPPQKRVERNRAKKQIKDELSDK